MENTNQASSDRPNPRRRKRDPKKIFIEAYLPVIIAVAVLFLILFTIVIGVVGCSVAGNISKKQSEAAEESRQLQEQADRQEADELIAQANELALAYDFEGAIAILNQFGNKIYKYDDMLALRDSYEQTKNNLTAYSGQDVVHLSVQVLIADAKRAFSNKQYGDSFKLNFITTEEFSNLLQQLYDNGYVLIDMDDILEVKNDDSGNSVFVKKSVKLPADKKPLMLTQTQVNYYTYMVDPDQDGIPDKNGAGFASKLIVENGSIKNEMVTDSGETVTGNYDMVPILEDFIQAHPDFSYKGARAILAVTGYNGIFGYRGDNLSDVTPVLDALRNTGYHIAYYTYYNTNYSTASAEKIADEATRWNRNITPVLGEVNYMVYALSGDISKPGTSYSGQKFAELQKMGMQYYLGFCTDGKPWFLAENNYIRMGRILANAENLTKNPQWFEGICDPSTVLIETR